MYKLNENVNSGLQVVEIDQRKFAIEWREGAMNANLTQMAKPFGKIPKDWLRTDEAKRYLNALSSRRKCLLTDLVKVKNGGRSDEKGTWACDHNVTVEFARWLDPMFAVKVNELFWNLFTGQSRLVPKEEVNQQRDLFGNPVIVPAKRLAGKRLINRLDRNRLIRLLALASRISDNELRIAITNELTGGLNYGNI